MHLPCRTLHFSLTMNSITFRLSKFVGGLWMIQVIGVHDFICYKSYKKYEMYMYIINHNILDILENRAFLFKNLPFLSPLVC